MKLIEFLLCRSREEEGCCIHYWCRIAIVIIVGPDRSAVYRGVKNECVTPSASIDGLDATLLFVPLELYYMPLLFTRVWWAYQNHRRYRCWQVIFFLLQHQGLPTRMIDTLQVISVIFLTSSSFLVLNKSALIIAHNWNRKIAYDKMNQEFFLAKMNS